MESKRNAHPQETPAISAGMQCIEEDAVCIQLSGFLCCVPVVRDTRDILWKGTVTAELKSPGAASEGAVGCTSAAHTLVFQQMYLGKQGRLKDTLPSLKQCPCPPSQAVAPVDVSNGDGRTTSKHF